MTSSSGVTFRGGRPVVPVEVRQEYRHVEGEFALVERDPVLDNDVTHLIGTYAECVTYRDAMVQHHVSMGESRDFDIVPWFDDLMSSQAA